MSDSAFIKDSVLPIRPYVQHAISRAWEGLAAPGTWWRGEQRVALARAARTGDVSDAVPAAAGKAARFVATDAHRVEAAAVDKLEAGGVSREAYVEIVGLVSRVVAIDTALRGLGAPPLELPAARTGEPSRARDPQAQLTTAFVPTVGRPRAMSALSAVPAEYEAQHDLHGALYLTAKEMEDHSISKDIPRWQMELAATRTSLRNHCRF